MKKLKKMNSKISILFIIIILTLLLSSCGSKKVAVENVEKNVLVQKTETKKQDPVLEKQIESQKSELDESEEDELSDEELDELDDEEDFLEETDPLYYFNVAMFYVTDKTYFWVLKPISQCYDFIMPETIQIWIRNFFYNLGMPVRFVSNLLQFKFKDATAEIGRFLLNSTVGILGFGNPASYFKTLNPSPEDLGQAFGKWSIGEGFFLFLPFLGPSTLRDSVGLVGDEFLNPVFYIDTDNLVKYSISGFKMVNNASLMLGTYEAIKEAALDPYEAIRNGYLQRRRKEVAD